MTAFEILGTFRVDKTTGLLSLKQIEGAGKSTSDRINAQFRRTGDFIAKSIKMGAVVAGAAITGLAVSSLKSFVAYEKGMREVYTLLPGLSKNAKVQMMEDVEELAQAIGILPDEVVPALYQAISAGVPQDNVFDFMEIAGKAAKAGVTDLQTSVDGLSSVVNAYGAENITAAQAADLFFTTVRLGKTDFEQLSRYLFQVVPTAAAVGINFQQIAAGMAEITAKGVPTRVAATQLRSLLNELSTAGSDVNEVFTDLVEMSFTDFIETGGDLADVIALLEEYATANGLSMKDMFTSIEAGNAALNLGGQSLDKFRDKIEQTTDASDSMEIAYEEMAESVQQSLDELAAWWAVTKIEIGRDLIDDFSELLNFLDDHKDEIQDTLLTMMQGLISSLRWIVDNRNAIKVGLSIIAVGLAAILAITHPYIAALTFLAAGTIAIVSAFDNLQKQLGPLTGALAALRGETEPTADSIEEIVEALDLGEEEAKKFTFALEALREKYGDINSISGILVTTTLEQNKALSDLREEYYALADRAGLTGEALILFTQALRIAQIRAVEMGGDVAGNFESNMRDVWETFAIASGGMIEVLIDGTIVIHRELDEQGEVIQSFAEISIQAYAELQAAQEAYYQWQADEAIKWAKAQKDAVDIVVGSLKKAEGPITSVLGKIRDAYTGITKDLPAAEKTLSELAEVVGELSEEQKALRDSALEVRDEVTGAWDELVEGVSSSVGSFLDSVSDMIRSNRELAKSHEDTLGKIEDDHKDTYDDLAKQRREDLADLDKSLRDGAVTQEKYSEEKLRIQRDYNDDIATLDQARLDAIDTETQAYEDAKVTILDILNEMGRNLLVAVREELTLQAAKYLVMAGAALLNPLTMATAPGYFLTAAALGAGAAGLALTGYEKGGIATSPHLGIFGDTGVPEAVIPLTMSNLAGIGEGIAASLGGAGEGGAIGGDTYEININNPIVDSPERIEDLAVSLEELFETRERGKGKVRLRT